MPGAATIVDGDELRAPYIVNGTQYNGRASVGMLEITVAQGAGICTGTLVGSRTVLTAAHCFDDVISARFVVGGQSYELVQMTQHPSYDKNTLEEDVAVGRLASAPNVPPSAASQSAPTQGTQVVLVGFGLTATGKNDTGVKRGATATIGQVDAELDAMLGAGKRHTQRNESVTVVQIQREFEAIAKPPPLCVWRNQSWS